MEKTGKATCGGGVTAGEKSAKNTRVANSSTGSERKSVFTLSVEHAQILTTDARYCRRCHVKGSTWLHAKSEVYRRFRVEVASFSEQRNERSFHGVSLDFLLFFYRVGNALDAHYRHLLARSENYKHDRLFKWIPFLGTWEIKLYLMRTHVVISTALVVHMNSVLKYVKAAILFSHFTKLLLILMY